MDTMYTDKQVAVIEGVKLLNSLLDKGGLLYGDDYQKAQKVCHKLLTETLQRIEELGGAYE